MINAIIESKDGGIMYDGSAKDYETNIAETRELVRIAHSLGASVEGEIGHVGEAATCDNASTDRYTTVREAKDFLEATGVDALAIAIGTAHGQYKAKPCLDLKRLAEIRNAVDVPLVLHGGSGLSDDDFRNTVKGGICKINIFTDLCVAGAKAVYAEAAQQTPYLELRNMKVNAIREVVKEKIRLFGSENKA